MVTIISVGALSSKAPDLPSFFAFRQLFAEALLTGESSLTRFVSSTGFVQPKKFFKRNTDDSFLMAIL